MKYLIFLHIYKTAGASFNKKFLNIFGEENMYWHDVDGPSLSFDKTVILKKKPIIVGGHRGFSFYPLEMINDFYFFSLIREPLSRTCSLYDFLIRIGEKDSGFRKFWIDDHKLDPTSLLKTLKQSELFRENVNNYQCEFLSGNKSADFTMEMINNYPFLIGTMDNLEIFLKTCHENFDWPLELATWNKKPKSYLDESELNQVNEIVSDLNQEDLKLYNYIKEQGVFFNKDKWIDTERFKVAVAKNHYPLKVKEDILNGSLKQKLIKTNIDTPFILNSIVLENNSSLNIKSNHQGKYFLLHQLYKNGEKFPHNDRKTFFRGEILPGANYEMPFKLRVPRERGEYEVAVSISQDWFLWKYNLIDDEYTRVFKLIVE